MNVAFDLFTVTKSSYEELLIRDGTVSIHHRNIQTLTTEMFKVKNEKSPEIICDIFTPKINNRYNLRHINQFETPLVRNVYNGTEMSHILDLRFGTLFRKNTRH